MSLPILDLHGTPHEQGVRHGGELRDRIARNVAVYFERFEREVGLPRPEVLDRARRYAAVMVEQNGEYYAGMEGIAEGSGFSFLEVVALNVRYEILYHQWTHRAMGEVTDGCTSFAVQPQASANGHLLLGQNWDWIPDVQGAVLRTQERDGLKTLSFTEAGIFGGKIGLNSQGLGLAINGLISTADDWARLRQPFHVRCYEILRQREFDRALEVVTGSGRCCSTNFLIAQTPDRVVDIEAAPDVVRLIRCQDGCVTHANHFVDPGAMDVTEPPSDRRPFSCNRQSRLRSLLQAGHPITTEHVWECLRNHEEFPNSLCRHPDPGLPVEQRTVTVTGVVMDLHARTLELTDRQPCEAPVQRLTLA